MDKKEGISNPITFAEAFCMSYLQACMKEAMRIHPAVGQMLERVVPEGGAQFGDVRLLSDTVAGIKSVDSWQRVVCLQRRC
jgi:hypothetical protein